MFDFILACFVRIPFKLHTVIPGNLTNERDFPVPSKRR